MLEVILKGTLVSASLITAIGAQNAFVLKQGLARQHIFWVVLICFMGDAILMSVGVLGLGSLITASRVATLSLALCGAAFLFWYGGRSLRSAWRGNSYLQATGAVAAPQLSSVLTATLAVTWLNPHVYLDTVVLIGGVAATLVFQDKLLFLLGAVSASGIWFFTLGYGARLLAPLFQQPRTWQVFDVGIAILMWWLAWELLRFAAASV